MPEQIMPVFRQNGFGMKLHAFYGQCPVAHAHDLAIVGPGCDFQAIRQRILFNGKRMVAGNSKRIGQALEYTLVCMGNAV